MKKLNLLALTAASALALSAGAASAQAWMSINERQANLEQRIETGIRTGDLTRDEAMRLRGDFRAIADLEARYRADGLSDWERRDLDRRFDELSMNVRAERRDAEQRGDHRDRADRGDDRWDGDRNWRDSRGAWMGIRQREAQLERRIERGVRSGRLTRVEAERLRAEFRHVLRIEARYRINGLSPRERADLDRRFDQLAARIRWEQSDRDRYGAGYGDPR